MKLKILQFVLLFFCLFFHFSLSAQWESLGDSIISSGLKVSSIKIANDGSIWLISTGVGYPLKNPLSLTHRSTDGGKTWIHSSLTDAPIYGGTDISPIDSLTAFIALHTAGLYKTINGGRSWSKVQSYPYPCLLVHFFNPEEGWVFNGYSFATAMSASDPYVPILHSVTRDGGDTWTHIGGENWNQPDGTSLPEKDDAEIVGTFYSSNSSYDYTAESIIIGMAQGTYWLSKDKGYNWSRHETPLVELGLITSNVSIKDNTTIMVAGNVLDSILKSRVNRAGRSSVSFSTRDGGNSWIEGSPGLNAAALKYIPGSDSIFVMTGHLYKWQGSQGTAITYDYGANWKIIDNNRIVAIDFIDKKSGVGTCCNYSYWSTTKGTVFKWNFPLPESPKEKPIWYIWLIALIICIGVYSIYRYWRWKNLYKKETTEQISKLEQSAIRAQINPHFIFNCLSSIQSLVNKNDKEHANTYLVHFAQLTRGILRASSEDKIPLEDDIVLLKSYLELEKMRSNNLIEYSINIDDSIDLFDTMVPAMLVQPIVENSLIHGLTKQNEMGMIKIAYLLKDEYILITIEDNVKGVYQTGQKHQFNTNQRLKSVGIGDTQKRLDLIHANNEMKVEELISESGQTKGTKVFLKVLLD